MEGNSVPYNGTAPEGTAAIERAFDVLFHLHEARAPLGVSAIARSLGLPKSTAHRLLGVLVRRGLVEKDEAGLYRPGMALVALGLGVLERDPLVAAARPVLEEEARSLGETLFVVGARGGELVVLDEVQGTGLLRAAPTVGARVPVHATAAGRLFLAFAPEKLRKPRYPLEAFTDRTPVAKDALDARVDEARRLGHATNVGEWVPGLAVVSAAIRTTDGTMVGALALACAQERFAELGGDRLAEQLRQAAARIARRLEGKGT